MIAEEEFTAKGAEDRREILFLLSFASAAAISRAFEIATSAVKCPESDCDSEHNSDSRRR
jgi:hypothetical protein